MSAILPRAVVSSSQRPSTWSCVLRLRRKSTDAILRSRSTELRGQAKRSKRVRTGRQRSAAGGATHLERRTPSSSDWSPSSR